nr:type II toxin-antitoxin system RelE/ParE family toxin [Enterovirga sp. DB1703]
MEPAVEDLEAIHGSIARDGPRAADDFIESIRAHLNSIADTGFGGIGRPGRGRGTRELVHGRYVIVYRYDPQTDEILVISVVNGARRR